MHGAILGETCEERIAVGKAADGLELPFPVLDDGSETRAAIAGLVAGLRAATTEVCVVLPVDMPLVTPRASARARPTRASTPQSRRPGRFQGRTRGLRFPTLERRLADGRLALRDALDELETVRLQLDPALLANVNTADDLRRLG